MRSSILRPSFSQENHMKKKILVCSESSKVPSGFGVYNKRLLEGLYKTGKYEIAEFASYGLIGDVETFKIPWKYYPNAVNKQDPRSPQYDSSLDNQFGRWRFDRVLLDFKPDIVIDVRDYWMSYYQGKSPLRKYFHWILMPTVDSAPQKEEWLDTYLDANAVFTYSDWGRDVLKSQTSNKVKYIATTSPGVDLSEFYPENGTEIKQALSLPADSFVLGTIMRNQKRKLYPELIRAFEKILQKLDNVIAEKTLLYIHSSYPDAGWDFANLIKNSPVSNQIYFSYVCKSCGAVFASNFSTEMQCCYRCGQKAAVMPNVNNGLDTKVLTKVINSFDAYVQYAICEGFGMPQIEAAACGVPVFSVNYSAMEDVIGKLDATPINIGARFKELETEAVRVYPDENDFVSKMIDFICLPDGIRKRKGLDTRLLCERNYNWDNIIHLWTDYIDTVNSTQDLWNNFFANIAQKIDENNLPKGNNVYEIVYMLYKNHIARIGIKLDDYWLLKLIQGAQNGYIMEGPQAKPFGISNIVNIFNNIIEANNVAESARVNPHILNEEDYISYANNSLQKL